MTEESPNIDTMMYGRSVRTPSSSQQFVRKERKRRPLTPVEDILAGIALDQSRDVSIYHDDDDEESSVPQTMTMPSNGTDAADPDEDDEALQWTTQQPDEGSASSSSSLFLLNSKQEGEDTISAKECESPQLSPVRNVKKDEMIGTPETLPCTPEQQGTDKVSMPKFAVGLPLSEEERHSWQQSLDYDVTSPESSLQKDESVGAEETACESKRDDHSTGSNAKASTLSTLAVEKSIERSNNTETCISDDSTSSDHLNCLGVDMGDRLAIVSSVESKRQCWLQNELSSTRNEWEYYNKWLNDTVREVSKVEELIANSHVSLVQYTQHLAELSNGRETVMTRWSLSRRHRQIIKDISAETELGHVLVDSYRAVQDTLEEQVPAMTECVRNATVLKETITVQAEALAAQGAAICLDNVTLAEENTQQAFCILMDVLNEHEGSDAKVRRSDRWVAEASYRHAARNVMVLWKSRRRQLQDIYKAIITLDQSRRQQQQAILRMFLPLRKEMLACTRQAYELGIERLHSQAKQVVVNYNAFPESQTSVSANAENAYVKQYRFVDLKASTGWQKVMIAVTLDDEMHIFANYDDQIGNTMDGVKKTLQTKTPTLSLNPCHYEVSRNGMEIELLRPGRSKLFRKRDDHCVFRLSSEYEACKWFHDLHELTESGIHC